MLGLVCWALLCYLTHFTYSLSPRSPQFSGPRASANRPTTTTTGVLKASGAAIPSGLQNITALRIEAVQDGAVDDQSLDSITCWLDDSKATSRRAVNVTNDATTLSRRALVEKSALAEPADSSDEAFATFIENFQNQEFQIRIQHLPAQIDAWTVNCNCQSIKIGAIGVWYPFGNVPKNFIMQGLRGCTATIIVAFQGSIQLPPGSTCEADLGTDPIPWASWLCRISQEVNGDPNGVWANALKEATADIVAKNLTSQKISWFFPTRQIKTFHPRTPGMEAYRDSVVDAINAFQTNTISETPANTCAGSSDGDVIHWDISVDKLGFTSDECNWAQVAFPACFNDVDGGSDCVPTNSTPSCAPSDLPDDFSATFDSNSQCDSKVVTDCINSAFEQQCADDQCLSS